MTIDDLRLALASRGGDADVWLVYQADAFPQIEGRAVTLVLQRAFWTRGEAYAFAHAGRQQATWRHYYVYRVHAHPAWLDGSPALAEYETHFGRERDMPVVHIEAPEVASLLDS